ncbi:hypothetical protein Tco_0739329, partial [Tanacetum coccineum]
MIQNMDSIEQCIVERARHEQELQNRFKRLNERKLQIQECKVQEVRASDASLGDNDCSRIVSDNGNVQGLENQRNTSGDESNRSRNESEYNVFAIDTQHSKQPESISNTCLVEQDDSNVIPDSPDMSYEISVVKEKHDELVKQSLLTKSHYEGLVKEKTRELADQAWVKDSKHHFRALTAHDMEILIKTCLMPLSLKTQNDSFAFVHELKQEMHADLKYVESLEKEIDELESDKAEFSNMYDMLLQECVSNDVMCSYLHSLSDLDAHAELQCLYVHKVKECECLAQKLSKQTETVSKEVYNELLRSFAKLEKHSISLELALQQCQEQMKNDTVCKEKASNVFLKEREQYFEIQDLKAQLQDKNIA